MQEKYHTLPHRFELFEILRKGKWKIKRILRLYRVGDGHILPVYCRQGPREIVAKAKAVDSRFGKH